jgi:AraC-like DNA-binding protein
VRGPGTLRSVLTLRTVSEGDGLTVADVACRHRRGRGQVVELRGRHALVLVRRGCFVREVDGTDHVLDATSAYALAPGQVERYHHPHDDGDDCTMLAFTPEALAQVRGGELDVPATPWRVDASLDLRHRRLLAELRRGDDPGAALESATLLAAAAFGCRDPARMQSGRPASLTLRRRACDAVRELLAADPSLSLGALARHTGLSPHHLSRTFTAITGATVSEHRRQLRARDALERLAGGERDLARVAADAGFADHSHLVRELRRQTGRTPSALRALLARPDA